MSWSRARLRWFRTPPRPEGTLSCVARFEALEARWPDVAWSVVLDLQSAEVVDGDMLVNVRMLVEDAPSGLLSSGSRFDLMAGATRIAAGEVIGGR